MTKVITYKELKKIMSSCFRLGRTRPPVEADYTEAYDKLKPEVHCECKIV